MRSPIQTLVHFPAFFGLPWADRRADLERGASPGRPKEDQRNSPASELGSPSWPSFDDRPCSLLPPRCWPATMAARAYAPAPEAQTVLTLAGEDRPCPIPAELARFEFPLARLVQRLTASAPVRIVAIGSSSTFGEGASSPEAPIPAGYRANCCSGFPASASPCSTAASTATPTTTCSPASRPT